MSEEFQWSEFGSDGTEQDPDFHFASRHSPDLKYKHIIKSNATIDDGLSDFDENERENLRAYSSISIFRETMEYLEEFGIYLSSVIYSDKGFIDAMTRAETSDIKRIFSQIRDEQYETLFEDSSEFSDLREFLSWTFGYNLFLDSDSDKLEDLGSDNLTVDSKEEAVEVSLNSIEQKLQQISWFFLYFDEAYNAVKHGNRVSISTSGQLEIKPEEGGDLQEIEVDEPVADFLCKMSGNLAYGKRYIFSAPVNRLREHSVAIANVCRDVFSPIYEVSHSYRESDRKEQKERISFNTAFFGIEKSDGDTQSYNYVNFENPDSTLWIPQELVPDQLKDVSSDFSRTTYAALKEEYGKLIIETAGNDEPSYDYPIQFEGFASSDENNMIRWKAELNFNFRISQLPLWQYKELLELEDHSPFDSVVTRNPDADISKKKNLKNPVKIPHVEKPDYWGLLHFAWRVGLAADVEIMYPVFLYEAAAKVLEKYKDRELTRERAKQCLQELAVVTSDYVYTEVIATKLDPEKRTESGFQILDSTVIKTVPGAYTFQEEGGVIHDISIDDTYPNEFERGDPGQLDTCILMLVQEAQDEIFDLFSNGGIEILKELTQVQNPENAKSCITINREHGIATHWYWFDRLKINIYSGIPDHANDNIEQLYS